jgi:hypothetical protein
MCAVCKQGVSKTLMIYQKGRVFHERCFETYGNQFPPINQELAQESARTRVELVQMKNLKARTDAGLTEENPKQKARPKKKTKKSKSKKSVKRSKKSASKKRK